MIKNTYRPDNCLHTSFPDLIICIFLELWNTRLATWQLFLSSIVLYYKYSILGVFWLLFFPIITLIATIVMLPDINGNLSYKLILPVDFYFAFGIILWQTYASILSATTRSLVDSTDLISKVKFSRKSLVISSALLGAFSGFVQLLIFSITLLIYCIIKGMEIGLLKFILIFISLIPVTFFAVSMGFIMGLLAGISRDFISISALISGAFFFITPIVYTAKKYYLSNLFLSINPLYYLIIIPRDLIFLGFDNTHFISYIFAILLFILLLVLILYIFHISEVRVSEKL